MPQLDPEVLSYFAPEAQEYLESLEAQLLRLEKEPQNPELINQLFRTAHTLKGSARAVGAWPVATLAETVEKALGGATAEDAAGPVSDLGTAVAAAQAAAAERCRPG